MNRFSWKETQPSLSSGARWPTGFATEKTHREFALQLVNSFLEVVGFFHSSPCSLSPGVWAYGRTGYSEISDQLSHVNTFSMQFSTLKVRKTIDNSKRRDSHTKLRGATCALQVGEAKCTSYLQQICTQATNHKRQLNFFVIIVCDSCVP